MYAIRSYYAILPFAYLLTAKKITEFYRKTSQHSKSTLTIILGILFGWLIIGTVAAYPYYISYFNEAAGAVQPRGFRCVV